MAASGDVDRVLPAMLPSPCERLPLPGLCPGGSATGTRANSTPCHYDDLTGDPATPAIPQACVCPLGQRLVRHRCKAW